MREFLTPSDVANTAMMLKTDDSLVLVVEGITDRRLYGKFIDPSVKIVIAHSKTNVKESVKIASSRWKCKYVIGIVDADLDYIKGNKNAENIFLTDTRDSETMMLKSDAFEDVIAEFGDSEKIQIYEKALGRIKDNVLKSSYAIGIMMYLSEKYGWNMSFKNLDFGFFVDRKSMRLDVRKMVQSLVYSSLSEKSKEIQKILEAELKQPIDSWKVCRGHDAMTILAMGLKNNFGSWNCKYMNGESLSGNFRLAFDKGDMMTTELFKKSLEWSKKNGFVLWKITEF